MAYYRHTTCGGGGGGDDDNCSYLLGRRLHYPTLTTAATMLNQIGKRIPDSSAAISY